MRPTGDWIYCIDFHLHAFVCMYVHWRGSLRPTTFKLCILSVWTFNLVCHKKKSDCNHLPSFHRCFPENATCDNKHFSHEGALMNRVLEPLSAARQDRARHVIKNTKDIYCENTWALCLIQAWLLFWQFIGWCGTAPQRTFISWMAFYRFLKKHFLAPCLQDFFFLVLLHLISKPSCSLCNTWFSFHSRKKKVRKFGDCMTESLSAAGTLWGKDAFRMCIRVNSSLFSSSSCLSSLFVFAILLSSRWGVRRAHRFLLVERFYCVSSKNVASTSLSKRADKELWKAAFSFFLLVAIHS